MDEEIRSLVIRKSRFLFEFTSNFNDFLAINFRLPYHQGVQIGTLRGKAGKCNVVNKLAKQPLSETPEIGRVRSMDETTLTVESRQSPVAIHL